MSKEENRKVSAYLVVDARGKPCVLKLKTFVVHVFGVCVDVVINMVDARVRGR